MSAKTVRIIAGVIATALALVVGWSISAGHPVVSFLVPVAAIVIAMLIMVVVRRRAKEVTQDERTSRISERASAATIRVTVPLMAAAAIIILVLQERLAAEVVLVGNVVAYIACGLLLAQAAFYAYFGRKL